MMTNSKLQGVLWDLDGLLVDTEAFHFQAWQKTSSDYGFPFSREQFQATFGMNNQRILAILLGSDAPVERVEEISQRKEQHFREAIRGQAQILPGAIDLLERYKSAHIVQAIASSAPLLNVESLVDELNIRPYFRAVVSGEDLPSKPDPTLFLRAAETLGCEPEYCLVFEDAVVGVSAALQAGMKCVAVTNTHPAGALSAAHLVVDRLDHLPPRFEEMLFPGGY